MYCRNCGKEINDRAAICLSCGAFVGNDPTFIRNNPIKTEKDIKEETMLTKTAMWFAFVAKISVCVVIFCFLYILTTSYGYSGYGYSNIYFSYNKSAILSMIVFSALGTMTSIVALILYRIKVIKTRIFLSYVVLFLFTVLLLTMASMFYVRHYFM